MINNVQNTRSFGTTPFNDFSRNGDYYLTRQIAKDIYKSSEENKEKKGKKIGLIVALSSVVATLGVFLATKGLPKRTYKYLMNLTQKLEENVANRKQNGQSGPVTSFLKYSLKKLNTLAEKSTSLNNITSYKDLLFKKIMFATKPTKKIHTKITELFERLALKTVNRGYKKSDSKFAKMFNAFAKANEQIGQSQPNRLVTINGITKSVQEWLADVTAKQAKIQQELQTTFSVSGRKTRLAQMKKSTIGLDEKVWKETLNGALEANSPKEKLTRIKDSQMYHSFIAEDLLAADKSLIAKQVNQSRRAITHDVFDTFKASETVLDDVQQLISPKDAESSKLIRILRAKLGTYKKLSGSHEQQYREVLNNEILDIMNTLCNRITDSSEIFNYSNKTAKQILAHRDELQTILTKSEKGELQEILTIYKALLPNRNDYLKLRGTTTKAVSSLDKAIETENDLFFDKLRDLSLGSAPTDVLSIVGSVAGVGAGLTMADNRDERISAVLKYGIPIVGSVATSLLLTVSLVAGIKSMIIGGVSGLVMNAIGSKIDAKRKEYNKEAEDLKHAEAVKAEITAKSEIKPQTA